MKNHKNGCRKKEFLQTDSTKLFISDLSTPILGKTTLIVLLPALFYGCSSGISINTGNEEYSDRVMIRIAGTKGDERMDIIDIFAFDDDSLMHLDSYQHLENPGNGRISLRSQNGCKTVFACANSPRGIYDWADINTPASLDKVTVDLRKERRESPFMTGQTEIEAGKEGHILFRKMVSEIYVRSIRCDFSGKSYSKERIRDVKVYLTNVNAECSMTADGEILPTCIINNGEADPEDISAFTEPDIIYMSLEEDIGSRPYDTGIRLLCYPNAGKVHTPGTPFTRLVIEGRIEGETYWWPIEINRDGKTNETGIYRNRQYIFDLTIKRKGSSGPDKVIEKEDVEISMQIRQWDQKEEYRVSF